MGIFTEKSPYATESYVSTVTSGTKEYVDSSIITLSGVAVQSFAELTDTPDTYPGHTYYYAVSSASGIEWKSDYLDGEIHISPEYTGDSNGSATNPFKTIAEAATFAGTTYSGTGKSVAVILHPGEYLVPHKIIIDTPEIKAFIGTDNKTVVIKPDSNMIGQSFIEVYTPIEAANITIDATDIPAFATTEGTNAIMFYDDSYEENLLKYLVVKGFHRSLCGPAGSNIYANRTDIMDTTIGVCLASGTLFDADLLYIDGARERHISVTAGAEAYISQSEFSSYYIDGATNSGTAIYAEGENTYVEIFGGTNIWSCDKNLVVKDGAELKVDNCVLEETNTTPGIEQLNDSFLTIVNSRAPLSSDDISVSTPENVYINAFDSSGNSFVFGNAAQSSQVLFSLNTGSSDRPNLSYYPTHNTDYRALAFVNPVESEKTEFFAQSNNADVNLGIHPVGTAAWSSTATLGLVSIQDNERRGWTITKEEGAVPSLTFTNKNDDTAMTMNYSAEVMLNTGVYVNKILDEDDFASNDPKALITQQSSKAFVENYTYSSTAINTISGSLDDKMLYADGSKELTGNWDAGDFTITAEGFEKDKMKIDLAGYANVTGVLTGGAIEINSTDDTKLDISSGTAVYVDMSDRTDPIVEIISWPAQEFSPNLSGLRSKWIGVQRTAPNTGSLIATTEFSQLDKRTVAILGRCWGLGTDTITGRGQYTTTAFGFGKTTEDIAYALGSINIYGNKYVPTASGSMTLSRTAGQAFRFSANYSNDETSSNISDSVTVSGINTYQYHLQDVLSTNLETEIDPDYYDLDGTKTAVPAGKWTTQLVYFFPVSNITHVVYGQHYHDSFADALEHSSDHNYNLNTDMLAGSILRAYAFVKQGCTDLTDKNSARIVEVTSLGTGGAAGGGVTITDHGALIGLGDDDHQHYILADGTRDFSNKVSYSFHPTFSADTEIVDKKYVDDEIAGLTTDHGELTGLSDDDHPQYHNDARGDARYYTQNQVDTISGALMNQIAVQTALATVQLERDIDFSVQTTWSDVEFETTAYENEPSIIEHDDSNPERILIKADGTYSINYGAVVEAQQTTTTTYARIQKNGTTAIQASDSQIRTYYLEQHELAGQVTRDLQAGDYITFQLQRSSDGTVDVVTADMNVIKLDGVKGEKGDTGDQGPPGFVTVSGSSYFDAYDSAGSLTLNTSWQDVPFNVIRKNSGEYTLTSNTELTIPSSHTYHITARVTTDISSGTSRSDCKMRLVKDTGSGYIEVPGSLGFTYNRTSGEGTNTANVTILDDFVEGDKIKVQVAQDSGGSTLGLLPDGSSLTVHIPAGAPGPQGPAGADGVDGTDAGGTLAVVQARRTTTYSNIPTSWTDLTFDVTDLEYDEDVIEHDDTNRDRFQIKRDGYYYLAIGFSVDDEASVRFRKNDNTVLPGSTRPVGNTSDANDMVSAMQNACVAQLSSGDYVTVQIQAASTAENLYADATFIIFELVGSKGEKGDPGTPGSGSTVNIYEDGSPVANTPHSLLNFTGDIDVSDVDGDQVNINVTIPTPVFGSEYAYAVSESESNTNSAYTYVTKVTLNVTSIPAGTYRVGWFYEWRRDTTSNDFLATVEVDSSSTLMEHREESQDVNSWHTESGFAHGELSSGNHTITLGYCGDSTYSTSYIRRARIEFWRVS